MATPPGRSLWAALHLLDRQVLDCNDAPVAKVDDLLLSTPEEEGGLPVVTDILCGQAALAHRFNRRLGRAFELLRRVIEPASEPGPGRISFGVVKDIGTGIKLTVERRALPATVVERFLAQHVLSHIPGSGFGEEDGDATQ